MSATATTSLRGLRTFCIAARLQSFQEAGKVLFITASAVSHQIKSLEQELGVPLFERGGRELKLTATGQALYEDVGSLIEQLDGVISDYKNSGRRSTIRISVQPFLPAKCSCRN
ncbi:MAG: LysR family transcriptional regulator [Pseudomonadota bacterium]